MYGLVIKYHISRQLLRHSSLLAYQIFIDLIEFVELVYDLIFEPFSSPVAALQTYRLLHSLRLAFGLLPEVGVYLLTEDLPKGVGDETGRVDVKGPLDIVERMLEPAFLEIHE